jgi:hypothetical protein
MGSGAVTCTNNVFCFDQKQPTSQHSCADLMTGMLFSSGILLFYTAIVVPVQIFLWDYSDSCNMFPTLYFDILVDLFFMVSFFHHYSLWIIQAGCFYLL